MGLMVFLVKSGFHCNSPGSPVCTMANYVLLGLILDRKHCWKWPSRLWHSIFQWLISAIFLYSIFPSLKFFFFL
jgi:hypothetical protein